MIESVESNMNGPREEIFPLSFPQQRLWFLYRLDPVSSAYNIPQLTRIKGKVNITVLERSIEEIIRRHEIIRSVYFFNDNGDPVQRITPCSEFKIKLADLGDELEEHREAKAMDLAEEEALRPFNLETGPLLRACLIRLKQDDHLFILTVHHIISDGWSMDILFREMSQLYTAFSRGEPSPLPDLPIQYTDYIAWQKKWLRGEKIEAQKQFWKEYLKDIARFELSADHPRPAIQTHNGAKHTLQLPKQLTDSLKGLSRRERVTLFMTLLTAFQVLLYRYTGLGDIVVGIPAASRNRAEIEGLIGFFVNTLVIRTDASDNPVFLHLLKTSRRKLLDVYEHQDLPFEHLVKELNPKRDMSRNPLFQISFALQNVSPSSLELPGLTVERVEVEDTMAKFDLEVSLEVNEEGLRGSFIYNTDLFDTVTIERLAANYQIMLEGIAADPERKLSELPFLTGAEQHKGLVEYGDRESAYPPDKCIHELFEKLAERTPDAVAVRFEDKRLSYRELNDKANQLAHFLRQQGTGPEKLAGLCVERSVEMVIGILGVLKAGGAYVPLDPAYPKDRLGFIIEDTGLSVVITQKSLLDILPTCTCNIICIDTDGEELAQCSRQNPSSGVMPDNAAYVIYTSGSTGKPKGVIVEHFSVVRLFKGAQSWYQFNAKDVWTLFHSFAFDFSVWELWGALLHGGTLVVVPYWISRSSDQFRELLQREKVTVLNITPSAFRELVQADIHASWKESLSLRYIIFGGDELRTEDLRVWYEHHDDRHPRLANMYGITETTVHVTFRPLSAEDTKNGTIRKIGVPLPDQKIYLLDNNMEPVPAGVPGEIYVGGAGLAREYLGRPQLTAERFIPDRFSGKDGARLYKSGDLGRYASDGTVEFLGRIDQQVKIRGYRIEPGEIESILVRHDRVMNALVMAREDIDGNKRIIGYVVVKDRPALSIKELRDWVKGKLPDHMIPSLFVYMDAFPLTPNGKIDRQALPAPEKEQTGPSAGYVAPRNELEKELTELWGRLLGQKRIGIYDDFFESGGDSLMATRCLHRMEQITGAVISHEAFYKRPSVFGVVSSLDEHSITAFDPPATLSIQSYPASGPFPLSISQEEIWSTQQIQPDLPVFNESFTITIKNNMDVSVLEQAFRKLIRRHSILRTAFREINFQPVQFVLDEVPWTLSFVDLRPVSSSDQKDEAKRIAENQSGKVFDLGIPPLMRATLVRFDTNEYRLYIVFHHLLIDAITVYHIFVPELWTLYKSGLAGNVSGIDGPAAPYSDYVQWQRNLLSKEFLRESQTYWEKQLAGSPLVDMPTDRLRSASSNFKGAFQTLSFTKTLTRSLHVLGQQNGATLFMVLLAAFKVLLWRYARNDVIVVGSSDGGRSRPEFEKIAGCCLNSLILRTDLSGNPSFVSLLRRVRETALQAYAHKYLPFGVLAKKLKYPRDIGRHPLFRAALVLEPSFEEDESGWVVSQLEVQTGTTKFELAFELEERPEGIIGRVEYDTSLFNRTTIGRLIGQFEVLLGALVDNPERLISDLPLLTEDERHQLLVEWNDTSADYPEGKCIPLLFEEQVEKTPDAIAVISGEQQLTYRELNSRANQLTHYLRARGTGQGIKVGICLERSVEAIVSIMAVLKAGGVYVPLDPSYPEERLSYIIKDSRSGVMIMQEPFSDTFREHDITIVEIHTEKADIGSQSTSNPSCGVSPKDSAYVIYTSGSTGLPKGVVVSHEAIAEHCFHMVNHYELDPRDRVLQFASLNFDASLEQVLAPLLAGAAIILRNRDLWTPSEFHERVLRYGLTVVNVPPSYFHEWVKTCNEAAYNATPDRLRLIICGGDELLPQTVRLWEQSPMSSARLLNAYGPTETTITATTFEVNNNLRSNQAFGDIRTRIPIGRPLPNRKIYILDTFGNPVPAGVPGELYIGGAGLAQGYLDRPELTAEKFVTDPFNTDSGKRLYKTGDLARYLSDGNIEFLGRIDHQVKIRGFRIETGEVEVVLGQHPGIKETVVTAREVRPGDNRLIAYVVREPGQTTALNDLRSFLQEKLPEYMVPSVFVMLDSLPLTPAGKIDRKSLPEPHIERPDTENECISPRTQTEKLLAGIWCEVLGISQVGIHDNFFSLGGHSLLATQVMSRIKEAFHVEVALRRLFETPTVAGLSDAVSMVVDKKQGASPEQTATGSGEEGFPLSFAQQRLWFLNQLEPESPAYNIMFVIRLIGHINTDALEKSISEVLKRHEVLRSVFSAVTDEPVQRINHSAVFTLQQVDISNLPEQQREPEAKLLAREELSRVFDLEAGPLLRAVLAHLKPQEHILILTVHHIVYDAWSTGILYRELSAYYEAFAKGLPASLPELPMQYAEYAFWQRKWLDGEKLEEQIRFWKEHLRDLTPLDLPADHPRPEVQTFNGAKCAFHLPADVTDALRGLSRKERVTMFMALLAAFQVMLHRHTGQSDIAIGTPIANRNLAAIEGLIGFFVNTLVIRTDTSGNPAFRELLARVRNVLLDAYSHQDLPFEKLVEELKPRRDLSRNPLFQVLFTLQNSPVSNLELAGLTVSRMELEYTRTRFDLEVHLSEEADGLRGAFIYNTDLFDAATISRMAGHYQMILKGIAADPDQRLSELPLLTDTERHQLLAEWNETKMDYPRDACVHDLFQEQVQRTPEAVAVIFGDERLTYTELNDKANKLARFLRKAGAGPEILVGICAERSVDMVICVMGVIKAGGAYVPLDPEYPKERLGFMLEDSGALLLLTQTSLAEKFPENKANVISLDQAWRVIENESTQNLSETASSGNLAYVLYTSGSTGRPKGVAMQHRPLCNLISWQIRTSALSPGAKTLQFAPLSFDVSFQEIFSTLCSGGTLVVASRELRRDPVSLLHYLDNESVQRLFLPFVALQQIAEVADWYDSFPHGLREVITAGEQLRITPSITKMFERLADCRLYNQYGPTESHVVTSFQLSGPPVEWPALPPIGRPISNAEIYLLDGDYNPVPRGCAGELYIGGECLAREYINRPGLTREKFLHHPFSSDPEARLYKTGDIARYLSDGNIEYLGRCDDQVKVRGYRIEPGEIESLLEQHKAVREAVVTVKVDDAGEKRLFAYMVLHDNYAADDRAIRRFLMDRLPDYMVPSVIVMMPSMPLTPSGKIDRRALPVPERNTAVPEKHHVAPRSMLEVRLTEIWEKVLDVRPVSITDNFFEIGGHSLLIMRMISEIRKATGVNLTVLAFFQAPTIAQMASIIHRQDVPALSSSAIPVQPHGEKVPLFWVSGSYFVRHLASDQPVYLLIDWEEHGYLPNYATIEDIADQCIRRLLAERPQGPYILGGYCMWGVVAMEIARRLVMQGQDVPLLFLVDVSVRYPNGAEKNDGIVGEIPPFSETVLRHLKQIRHLGIVGKTIYVSRKSLGLLNWLISRLLDKIKIVICRTYLNLGRPVPRTFMKFYVYNIYAMKLLRKYVPKVYPGRVVLIKSDVNKKIVTHDWLELIKSDVSVHVIPETGHIDLLNEPHVGYWAKLLNAYICEVQSIDSGACK